MNAETLKAKLEQSAQDCAAIADLWRELIPTFCPDERQFKLWLSRHTFDAVVHGVQETSGKLLRMGTMTPEHLVRFASRCMIDHKKATR
jgi:hypothetical protein